MNDINGFLFGGGGYAAKFDKLGDKVAGEIISAEMVQQTSMEDNTPLFWDDGKPRMQLVVTLQTDQRDPEDEDDEGIRRVYAKGGRFEAAEGEGQSMKDAIGGAVKKAGAKSLDEGATLAVAYTGIGKKKTRGYSAPKLYTAQYKAPTISVSADDLFDD
jgi:hypothetical protein